MSNIIALHRFYNSVRKYIASDYRWLTLPGHVHESYYHLTVPSKELLPSRERLATDRSSTVQAHWRTWTQVEGRSNPVWHSHTRAVRLAVIRDGNLVVGSSLRSDCGHHLHRGCICTCRIFFRHKDPNFFSCVSTASRCVRRPPRTLPERLRFTSENYHDRSESETLLCFL